MSTQQTKCTLSNNNGAAHTAPQRTEAYERLVQQIARYTGTGYECTERAVEAVLLRYPGQKPEEVAGWILVHYRARDTRGVYVDFQHEVRAQELEVCYAG